MSSNPISTAPCGKISLTANGLDHHEWSLPKTEVNTNWKAVLSIRWTIHVYGWGDHATPLSFLCRFLHSHRLKNTIFEAKATLTLLWGDRSSTFYTLIMTYALTPVVNDRPFRRLSHKETFQLVSYTQCDMAIMLNPGERPTPYGMSLPLSPKYSSRLLANHLSRGGRRW